MIITDITAGQKNRCFAEIGPYRRNLLHGIIVNSEKNKPFCCVLISFLHTLYCQGISDIIA